MRKLLAAIVRMIDARIGWHRIGIALSLGIIAIAVTTLVRLLREVDVHKIVSAVEATPHRNIAIAVVLVACSYVTLTFYDLFALRTIGRRHVPYRIAAMAAFTSYSIGHNIGATVFTGGAIRFRIYSAWGLSVLDVAKMAFVTGLTFWLGNLFVLGVGLSIDPDSARSIDQLPAPVNRAAGIALLIAIAAYLAWVRGAPRCVGRDHWEIRLPTAPLTLVQIVIGVFDLGLSGLAMFMLLPAEAGVGFIKVLVTFVVSTLLGFASHAPGGLGVFDASMLVSLWQFEREELLAALVLFRLIYYIVPFGFALLVLGSREISLNLAKSPARKPETPPASPCQASRKQTPP